MASCFLCLDDPGYAGEDHRWHFLEFREEPKKKHRPKTVRERERLLSQSLPATPDQTDGTRQKPQRQ